MNQRDAHREREIYCPCHNSAGRWSRRWQHCGTGRDDRTHHGQRVAHFVRDRRRELSERRQLLALHESGPGRVQGVSLRANDTPAVRFAFENYDLTFLVHSSIERNRSIIDHWLEQVGVSTNTLMSARMGRR